VLVKKPSKVFENVSEALKDLKDFEEKHQKTC